MPMTGLNFALSVPRASHIRALCAHKKTQHPAGPRDPVLLVVPAKFRCVTQMGTLASNSRGKLSASKLCQSDEPRSADPPLLTALATKGDCRVQRDSGESDPSAIS